MPYPFYALVYDKTLAGNGSVSLDPLNIQLGFTVEIYALTQHSTSTNYLFNFQKAGEDFPFVGVNQHAAIGVNMATWFPANVLKPWQLTGKITLAPSDRLLISLQDQSGSSNVIQLSFLGVAIV